MRLHRAPARILVASVPPCASEGGSARARGALWNAGGALGGAHVHVCGLSGCPEPAASGSAPGGGRRQRGEAAGGQGTGARPGRAGYRLPFGQSAPPPALTGPGSCAPGGAGKVCFELAPRFLVRTL